MKRHKRIDRVYELVKQWRNSEGITAHELAKALGISRANVSHDLNHLWKEGKVGKSQGRPVRFFPLDHSAPNQERETTLDKLAKCSSSLQTAVEQAKAAILYPPRGMHTLILGETGVGKTMFAGLIHRYAIEAGKLNEPAPFVTFNCADYAHNPQLLLAQLFGVKKGAYTGADVDRIGLLEKADGGILLLDEVHRLPAEGQEIFFTFLDKGVFRRLGETEDRQAQVLIISATTERTESALLKTFTRRIPMLITLPSLRERGYTERSQLIMQFFREEAYRLGKEILVSANVMRALLIYPCPNNVAQLKTDIQLACAKAYADMITQQKEQLEVYSCDLPPHVKEGLLQAKDERQVVEELIGHQPCFLFHPSQETLMLDREEAAIGQGMYEQIEHMVHSLRAKGVSDAELEIDLENFFSRYMRGVDQRASKQDLAKMMDPQILKAVEEIVDWAEPRLERTISQKVYFSMALHLQTLLERIRRGKAIVNPELNKIRRKYKKEFALALDCVRLVEERFGIELPIDEAGFFTMFFVWEEWEAEEEAELVSVLVMTHGESTASSMAEVTNRLLDVQFAQAIDLPLNQEPRAALEKARMIASKASRNAGLLLLVDMGSLLTFGEHLSREFNLPVRVVPLVSTLHVLEATRRALLGQSLEEICRELRHVGSYDHFLWPVQEGEVQTSPKAVILTVCMSGEGSALAMKNVLKHHLRLDERCCEIVPVSLTDRQALKTRLAPWKKEKDILCMVSNFTVDQEIPTFSLESVLNLQAIPAIQHLIDVAETYLRMGEVLGEQLRHVQADELVLLVQNCLDRLGQSWPHRATREDMIGICLHLCCMVDRLVSGEHRVSHPGKGDTLSRHPQLAAQLREVFRPLEVRYGIQISDDELCYVLHFFTENETLAT